MADRGEPPTVGTAVDVSGNPDKRVLKGEVWRHVPDEEADELAGGQRDAGATTISIMIPDGQEGAQDFQEWVITEGDIGVVPSSSDLPV